jgi:hypothetical protein
MQNTEPNVRIGEKVPRRKSLLSAFWSRWDESSVLVIKGTNHQKKIREIGQEQVKE